MAKADFDNIYTSPDPRNYYATLGEFDYEVPTHSAEMFGQVAQHLPTEEPQVIDLCCSYGVNATVMNHDVEFGDVVDHYTDPSVNHISREELLARDREWFAGRAIQSMSIDPEGREAEGWHHTDFYLVRPAEDAAESPLSTMLAPHSGQRSPGAGSRLETTVL